MNRKKFLKNGVLGLGSIIAIPTMMTSCKKDNDVTPNTGSGSGSETCQVTPTETAGPFPIKTPADWVRANVVGDRIGVALMIKIKIQNTNNSCQPLAGAYVDIWQCDSKGNYSEYDDQLDGNFTNKHFLRGRQQADANGDTAFISIYPGWYPGRAPHIHVEVLDSNKKSLLVTQIAFPENVSTIVYETEGYKGKFDTSNADDGVFEDSLAETLADDMTGNTTDGYTLTKIIKVAA